MNAAGREFVEAVRAGLGRDVVLTPSSPEPPPEESPHDGVDANDTYPRPVSFERFLARVRWDAAQVGDEDIAPANDSASAATNAFQSSEGTAPGWELPQGLHGFSVSGAALIAEADRPVLWAVEGLIEDRDVVLVSGEEKVTFKTWLLLDLAVARVVGGKWLGHEVVSCKPARVLVISPETAVRVCARRLRMLCRGRGVDPEEVLSYIHVAGERVSALPAEQMPPYKSRSLERWASLTASLPGTWGLVTVDTVRTALVGDENSSEDTAKYTQGARELSRTLGCPSVHAHHTSKGNAGGARAARGSVELTAGPDVLLSLATDEPPTVSYTLRSHESPADTGYRLVVERDAVHGDRARIETCAVETSAPNASKEPGVTKEEVFAVLDAHKPTALTESKIRKFVAQNRGAAEGSKVSASGVRAALAALAANGLAHQCEVIRRSGEPFTAWRAGPQDDAPAEAVHISMRSDQEDV